MRMNYASIISCLAGLFGAFLVHRCIDMPILPEAVRKRLIRVLQFFPVAVSGLGMLYIDTDKILMLFQKGCRYIGVFSLILALFPPFIAWIERKKDYAAAEKGYALKNLGFNLLGVACVWCMLFILYHEVSDFRFLQTIPVAPIISLTIPLCLWVVLSYQSTEQQEHNNLNHDPSLGRINQLLRSCIHKEKRQW